MVWLMSDYTGEVTAFGSVNQQERATLLTGDKAVAEHHFIRDFYREDLDRNPHEVGRLEELARSGPVTLLYGARDTAHNQAVVLADYLRERLEA